MKRIFTLLVFISLALNGYGQKIRFTDTSNRWTTYLAVHDPMFSGFGTYSYTTDTVLNGVVYKRFGASLLVREDTVTNKVYCRNYHPYPGYPSVDTSEHLLYDYGRVLGDSVYTQVGPYAWTFWVAAMDSVMMNNVWHKVWGFTGITTQGTLSAISYTLVEGIGVLVGGSSPLFTTPLYPTAFESSIRLTCFKNRHGQPPINSSLISNLFDNTTSCTLAVGEENKQAQSVSIAPNPCTATTSLICAQRIPHGKLVIYDLLGKPVYSVSVNNQNVILIGKYITIPGQYFYRLTDNEKGQTYSGKFIFQ